MCTLIKKYVLAGIWHNILSFVLRSWCLMIKLLDVPWPELLLPCISWCHMIWNCCKCVWTPGCQMISNFLMWRVLISCCHMIKVLGVTWPEISCLHLLWFFFVMCSDILMSHILWCLCVWYVFLPWCHITWTLAITCSYISLSRDLSHFRHVSQHLGISDMNWYIASLVSGVTWPILLLSLDLFKWPNVLCHMTGSFEKLWHKKSQRHPSERR